LWKSVRQDGKRGINDHVPRKKMEKKVGFFFEKFRKVSESFGKFRNKKKSRTLKSKEEEPRYPKKKRKRKEKKRKEKKRKEKKPKCRFGKRTSRGARL
jgi:hypothetical protein